jgi:hypothetical protein
MSILVNQIVEVLQTAPARFAKVFFTADIYVRTNNTIFIQISTTLDHYTGYLPGVPDPINPWWETVPEGMDVVKDEIEMEKFHQTGLALGTLEYYLNSENLEYTKIFQYTNNEIIAEYNILCPT